MKKDQDQQWPFIMILFTFKKQEVKKSLLRFYPHLRSSEAKVCHSIVR